MELGDKYLNGRDVLKRYDELESEFDDFIERLTEWKDSEEEYEDSTASELNLWMTDYGAEFKKMKALKEFIESYSGDGLSCTLILDEEFENYARKFAKDIGESGGTMEMYVDWERFADDLKQYYSESDDIGGYTYWVRN